MYVPGGEIEAVLCEAASYAVVKGGALQAAMGNQIESCCEQISLLLCEDSSGVEMSVGIGVSREFNVEHTISAGRSEVDCPIWFERRRKLAERFGVRTGEVDREVRRECRDK